MPHQFGSHINFNICSSFCLNIRKEINNLTGDAANTFYQLPERDYSWNKSTILVFLLVE
jgi:hypothetical protein